MKRIHDDKEFAIKTLGKYTKVTDAKSLDESYRWGIDSFYKDFKTPPEAMRLMVDQLASSRMIDPNLAQKTPLTAYYENRYVEELEREGFFKKLGSSARLQMPEFQIEIHSAIWNMEFAWNSSNTVSMTSQNVALLLVADCAATTSLAQDKPKIFVGPASKTLGYSPLWVGWKKGFFEQQGLDVEVVVLRGMPMVVQALAAGSIQFGCGGPEPFMESSDRGLDFIITGGVINGMTAAIVAGKKYKSFEDLRGTTVGSSALTGGTVIAFREALRQKGLEYPRDYKILVVAGGSPGNLAALQSGRSRPRPWPCR